VKDTNTSTSADTDTVMAEDEYEIDGACIYLWNAANWKIHDWFIDATTSNALSQLDLSVANPFTTGEVQDTTRASSKCPWDEKQKKIIPIYVYIVKISHIIQHFAIDTKQSDLLLGRLYFNREQTDHLHELQILELARDCVDYANVTFATWCDLSRKKSPFVDYPKMLSISLKQEPKKVYKELLSAVHQFCCFFFFLKKIKNKIKNFVIALQNAMLVLVFDVFHYQPKHNSFNDWKWYQPWLWDPVTADMIHNLQVGNFSTTSHFGYLILLYSFIDSKTKQKLKTTEFAVFLLLLLL
ncbi:hypothetical protein RFI_13670, partial [Reticulomyxa filosa]